MSVFMFTLLLFLARNGLEAGGFLSELPAAAYLQYKATVVKSLPHRVNYKFLSV